MEYHEERRKYRRFEIPEAKAKIKKSSSFSLLKSFSSYPVLNISIGGVMILFDGELSTGEVIHFELIVPEEKSLKFHAKVKWTNPVPLSCDMITGFEFLPFDEDKHHNSTEAMNLLRRLYARYIDR